MAFKRTPQTFNCSMNEVTFGTGAKAVTIGGENVYPLYTFDGEIKNKVAIGVEITDNGFDASVPGIAEFYAGCEGMAAIAKRASEMPGADFVVLTLEGADPNGQNKSIEECAAIAKEVADAIDCPLAVQGCKNIEKDTDLFSKVAEVCAGKNILIVSARQEDYKTIAASAVMAYGQKMSAESAVDINLAKQLNVLISQMGISADNCVQNVGSAAAGYGFEYVASTLDRVVGAALTQNDGMLQMPIVTPVGGESWVVKESTASEEDVPEWGNREERGIEMEVSTAAACITGGSNAVFMRHPEAVKTIANLVSALM